MDAVKSMRAESGASVAGQFCTVKLGLHNGRRVALKIVKPKWAKKDTDAINEMVSATSKQ